MCMEHVLATRLTIFSPAVRQHRNLHSSSNFAGSCTMHELHAATQRVEKGLDQGRAPVCSIPMEAQRQAAGTLPAVSNCSVASASGACSD